MKDYIGYRYSLSRICLIGRAGVKKYPTQKQLFCSDLFDPCMGDISDRIEWEFQLREAQKHRPIQEQECQSIRLEVLIGCRQTLIELQTQNRKDEKKVKLGSAIGEKLRIRTKGVSQGKVNGKENEETLDEKISIGIDKLNKDILISTDCLRKSLDGILNFAGDGRTIIDR